MTLAIVQFFANPFSLAFRHKADGADLANISSVIAGGGKVFDHGMSSCRNLLGASGLALDASVNLYAVPCAGGFRLHNAAIVLMSFINGLVNGLAAARANIHADARLFAGRLFQNLLKNQHVTMVGGNLRRFIAFIRLAAQIAQVFAVLPALLGAGGRLIRRDLILVGVLQSCIRNFRLFYSFAHNADTNGISVLSAFGFYVLRRAKGVSSICFLVAEKLLTNLTGDGVLTILVAGGGLGQGLYFIVAQGLAGVNNLTLGGVAVGADPALHGRILAAGINAGNPIVLHGGGDYLSLLGSAIAGECLHAIHAAGGLSGYLALVPGVLKASHLVQEHMAVLALELRNALHSAGTFPQDTYFHLILVCAGSRSCHDSRLAQREKHCHRQKER